MESSGSKAFLMFGKWIRQGELDLTAEEGCWPANSKSGPQAENKKRSKGINLDGGFEGMLDDALQEKLIGTMPFRSIFHAASLSKTWRLKFHSASFQREVHNSAASWESYSPLLVHHRNGLLVGYESRPQRWSQLPTHSYVPQIVDDLKSSIEAVDGPLLRWISAGIDENVKSRNVRNAPCILVGNSLTKSWKQLPRQPGIGYPGILHHDRPHFRAGIMHVVREGRAAYKVILGSLLESTRVSTCIRIFDSTDNSWTVQSYFTEVTTRTIDEAKLPRGASAVLNGVRYTLVCLWRYNNQRVTFKLISLDVKKNIWKESEFQSQIFSRNKFPQLVVCGSNLMLVIRTTYRRGPLQELNQLLVCQVDLESLLVLEPRARKGPHKDLSVAAGNGDCIYIGRDHPHFESSIPYNVGTQEWGTEGYWFDSARDIALSLPGTFACDWDCRSFRY